MLLLPLLGVLLGVSLPNMTLILKDQLLLGCEQSKIFTNHGSSLLPKVSPQPDNDSIVGSGSHDNHKASLH